ncbi:MAG: allantoinase AllB [Deltaproteobacteria bacterium]|nr:allantoinase AllB [Deltaproteobacteria bacterium]
MPDAIGPASVHVRDGRIVAVAPHDVAPVGCDVLDFGDAVVMPGVVDTHVHVNEPGRTEWEGFESATSAAAKGGVTTLVDMPLNSVPPTVSLGALLEKHRAAKGHCAVDVGFWGGVVPGNERELAPMVSQGGVLGFKCFLVDSGVDEFPRVSEDNLRTSMPILSALGVPLLVHAELPGPIDEAARSQLTFPGSPKKYATHLASRPRAAENQAIALMVGLCRETRARVHIVHHSSSDAIPLLREAKREGLPLTAETCPHYLRFSSEEIPDGATTFKCAPPIREQENRELLWQALGEGMLDMVASDHSPCSPALKHGDTGDFARAWGGIAGLQLSLPVTWTEAHRRGYTLSDIVRWMCVGPAHLAGLENRKGKLAVGLDADMVIWNPEERFRVEPGILRHRHKITPFQGLDLLGTVQRVFVRGKLVFDASGREETRLGQLLGR